jgi:glycerophosphoryl diester phosphodiesterase
MHTQVRRLTLGLAVALVACASADTDHGPVIDLGSTTYLPRSHSHNNYLSARPLAEALERGFASIEVDVFLVDGQLLVAHDIEDVQPSATLASMYLDPLRAVVRRNGGSVYGHDDPPLQLLVDVKSDADDTYRELDETLRRYEDILTTWTDGRPSPGALTVVLSGNRAIRLAQNASVRYLALDGRVDENRASESVDLIPLVSMDWEDLRSASLPGKLAEVEGLVERLHAEGRKVRFWGTPDTENVWTSLADLGVDYIGTDDVPRLDRVLRRVESRAALAID